MEHVYIKGTRTPNGDIETLSTLQIGDASINDVSKDNMLKAAKRAGKATKALEDVLANLRTAINAFEVEAALYGETASEFYQKIVTDDKSTDLDKLGLKEVLTWGDIGGTYQNAVYTYSQIIEKLNPVTNPLIAGMKMRAKNRSEHGQEVSI